MDLGGADLSTAEVATVDDALDILKGLAEGALDAEGIEILQCASDVETVGKDTITAITDFSKGGLIHDAEGVIALGKALASAKNALKECHAI